MLRDRHFRKMSKAKIRGKKERKKVMGTAQDWREQGKAGANFPDTPQLPTRSSVRLASCRALCI